MFDKTDLVRLVSVTMPFGRYEGRVIMDLPEEYLLWFRDKGFPDGDLGKLMALALELKINGLDQLLDPVRASAQPHSFNSRNRH